MNMNITSSANLSHRTSVSVIKAWEKDLENQPEVKRINEHNISFLNRLLKPCEDEDSYLTSATYYLFTGRNGLWAYGEDANDFLLICWHPNIPGKILIFPQFASSNRFSEFMSLISMPPFGIMIARTKVGPNEQPWLFSNFSNVIFRQQSEEVLDWKYPVHILSTQKVCEAAGSDFMYVRNRLRQMNKHSVNILTFDAVSHSRQIENLLHRWTNRNAVDKDEYENLYSPYENLFFGSMDKASTLSGIIIFVDDVLQSVGLWDISNTQKKTANLFVNLCNIDIKGLSELLITKCCEILHTEDVHYLNIGGSETEGLDRFKRKFHPDVSLDLMSTEIIFKNEINNGSSFQHYSTKFHV